MACWTQSSVGLRELPSVDLKTLPRMADYAEWGEATGRGLGWGAGAFMSTYNDNRKEATEALLEDSPVASVVLGSRPKRNELLLQAPKVL